MLPSHITNKRAQGVFITFIAIALQIQITLFSGEHYTGLRVNLADLILPFAGVSILWSLLSKQTQWTAWRIPYVFLWLSGLFLILCLALLNTYFQSGEISQWGMHNKIIGWLVLCAYFYLGGWLVTNNSRETIQLFIKVFCGTFFALLLFQIFALFAHIFPSVRDFLPSFFNHWIKFPIEGFMANRNAYAFLYLCVSAFMMVSMCTQKNLFPKKTMLLFFFLTPITLLDIGSRASFLAIITLFIVLGVLYKKKSLNCFIPFLCGCALVISIHTFIPQKFKILHGKEFEILNHRSEVKTVNDALKLQGNLASMGDSNRLKIISHALSLSKDNLLIGAGLGRFTMTQQGETNTDELLLPDSTPLWIGTEMGALGFLAFISFFCLILYTLYKDTDPKTHDFSRAVFLALICFGVMSIFHEILYTRHLWFIMGLSLAVPFKNSNATNPA